MSGFGGSGLSYPQFPIESHRVGETLTLPYCGQLFTAGNSSVWLAQNGIPVPYSAATYARLLTDAPLLVSAGVALPGPLPSGRWGSFAPQSIVGASTPGATWLATPGNAFPDYYYTSVNAGVTWTRRALPVAAKRWIALWDGTNFVLYAQATAGTGVQESTDGINWTPRTAISITSLTDLIYNGSVYLAWPTGGGTTCATSSDRTTWTSRTCLAGTAAANNPGLGAVTWNAGAGLFIASVSASSVAPPYQTSPTGQTWTARTSLDVLAVPSNGFLFASSATRTVAVGLWPFFAYSDNGLAWTLGTIDSTLAGFSTSASPEMAFYDGTHFVVSFGGGLVYYSADGVTWTRAPRMTLLVTSSAGTAMRTPIGIASVLDSGIVFSDVASAAATNVVHPIVTADASSRTYVRIK